MHTTADRSRFGFWVLSLAATLILTAGSGVSAGQAPHSAAGSNSQSGAGSAGSSQSGAGSNSHSATGSNSQSGAGSTGSSQSGAGSSQSGAGSNSKIAKDLPQGEQDNGDRTVDVIVQFKRGK